MDLELNKTRNVLPMSPVRSVTYVAGCSAAPRPRRAILAQYIRLRGPLMLFNYAISALLTLFVVVDPVGLTPTFLAVTEGLPRAARRSVALRASIIAGAILIGAALIGDWLLAHAGDFLSAFRIAGGLLLFSIASEMVFGVRMRREGQAAEQAVEEHVRNIAAFPLAIPLMAGPGAITATVLLAGRADGNLLLLALLIAVVVVVVGGVLRRLPRSPRGSAGSSA